MIFAFASWEDLSEEEEDRLAAKVQYLDQEIFKFTDLARQQIDYGYRSNLLAACLYRRSSVSETYRPLTENGKYFIYRAESQVKKKWNKDYDDQLYTFKPIPNSGNLSSEFFDFIINLFKHDYHLFASPAHVHVDKERKQYQDFREIVQLVNEAITGSTDFNINDSKFNIGDVNGGFALSNTEVHILYHFFTKKEELLSLIAEGGKLYIILFSLLDICNTCTFSLLHFALGRLLELEDDKIEIVGRTVSKYAPATLWARGGEAVVQTKILRRIKTSG